MQNKAIYYFLMLFILSINQLKAQDYEVLDSCYKKESILYINADQLPRFQNNENVMEFIYKNVNWPNQIDIEGTIIVSFIVTKSGNVCNIQIEKRIIPICDLEILRVIKMMKKWEPGILNNKPVNVLLYIPIQFSLQ